jgi:hypothetical protein
MNTNTLPSGTIFTETLPAGSYFQATDVAKYIKLSFDSEFYDKFQNSRWSLVQWVGKTAYLPTHDVMNWFLQNFDNVTVHPLTKFWSCPRTFAHQLYVQMQCEVSTYFQPKN